MWPRTRRRSDRRVACGRDDGRRPTTSPFAGVEEAIEEIRAGRFVVVVDDEDRENEGDLTIAAQFATPEAIASWSRTPAGSSACA